MAGTQRSRATLEGFFETGDQPTSQQIWDLVWSGMNFLDDGVTGTNEFVRKTSPTIVTPTIASFANAGHSHQDAAGGGTLSAAAIASGVLDNARVNWAAPGAIGSTTPGAGTFSALVCTGDVLRISTSKTPASSGAAGNEGEICWDTSYLYVYAGGAWRRIAVNTW